MVPNCQALHAILSNTASHQITRIQVQFNTFFPGLPSRSRNPHHFLYALDRNPHHFLYALGDQHLGPVIYFLFASDITDCMVDNVAVKLFADDAKIYYVIDDAIISSNQLQLSLDLVAAWADHWQLKLSPLKCSVMRLTENRYPHILVPRILLENTAFLLSLSARIWAFPMIIISILNRMLVGFFS